MTVISKQGPAGRRLGAALVCAGLLLGCGASGDERLRSDSPATLADLDHDLALGSRGPGVRAVYDYLRAFGYFPNQELALRFPAWRPIVGIAPAEPDVFDERIREAVTRLQSNAGLAPTGVVDVATRRLLRSPRCGVPDGIQELDRSDKFYSLGSRWNKQTLTFSRRYRGSHRAHSGACAGSGNALRRDPAVEGTSRATTSGNSGGPGAGRVGAGFCIARAAQALVFGSG